jgi:hypothetical protein
LLWVDGGAIKFHVTAKERSESAMKFRYSLLAGMPAETPFVVLPK